MQYIHIKCRNKTVECLAIFLLVLISFFWFVGADLFFVLLVLIYPLKYRNKSEQKSGVN